MKISTKSQYALEALIDLLMHAVDGLESLKNVAIRRGISEPYLDQIFNTLRKAGIVESIRGAQGGYRLAKEPQSITAGEVIRAVEGSLSPVKCIDSCTADSSRCLMFDQCATKLLWAKVSCEIDSVIDGVSLADLVNLSAPKQPEYSK